MFGGFNNNDLELDAIYLGMLTARRVKTLSRLEYPVRPCIVDVIKRMGLMVKPVKRLAQNGTLVNHWIMGKDSSLIEQYRSDFEGKLLEDGTAQTVRLEARYFGYPLCCAEAYIKSPYAPSDLTPEEQHLLFHYACPGCEETSKLLPLYQLALDEAEMLYKDLQRNSCVEELTI